MAETSASIVFTVGWGGSAVRAQCGRINSSAERLGLASRLCLPAHGPARKDRPNPAVTLRPSECGKTAGLHPEGRRSSQTILTLMSPVERRLLVKVFQLEKEN